MDIFFKWKYSHPQPQTAGWRASPKRIYRNSPVPFFSKKKQQQNNTSIYWISKDKPKMIKILPQGPASLFLDIITWKIFRKDLVLNNVVWTLWNLKRRLQTWFSAKLGKLINFISSFLIKGILRNHNQPTKFQLKQGDLKCLFLWSRKLWSVLSVFFPLIFWYQGTQIDRQLSALPATFLVTRSVWYWWGWRPVSFHKAPVRNCLWNRWPPQRRLKNLVQYHLFGHFSDSQVKLHTKNNSGGNLF